jgi:hypothetical protein
MEIELTADESTAVQTALRRYVSDLRMEIVDTDNPMYKRSLQQERTALESALGKLDASAANDATTTPVGTVRLVRLWWTLGSD